MSDSTPARVRVEHQVACLERELQRRAGAYKAAIDAGEMTREDAAAEYEAMRAALQTVEAAERAARELYAELWPFPAAESSAHESSAAETAAEPPPSDVVDDGALAERQRVRAEVRAMLQEVEAERESGASRDDVLAPCDRLCESGAIPEAAHAAARAAAGYVARGSQVGFAIDKALREAKEAAQAPGQAPAAERLTTPALNPAS